MTMTPHTFKENVACIIADDASSPHMLDRIADLAERYIVAAVQAEREECAKIADFVERHSCDPARQGTANYIGECIRLRSQEPTS